MPRFEWPGQIGKGGRITPVCATMGGEDGIKKPGTQKRPGKSHGRYARSIFRSGLDEIRRLLRTHPEQAFRHWPKISQKIA